MAENNDDGTSINDFIEDSATAESNKEQQQRLHYQDRTSIEDSVTAESNKEQQQQRLHYQDRTSIEDSVTAEDDHDLQKNDVDDELALIEKAFNYLTRKTYPPGCSKNDKRVIRRKAEKLEERNGEIFYKKRGGSTVRLITDQKERQKILLSCHRHPTSGHLGVRRTLSRITERFMWTGVTKDVTRMVAECHMCQKTGRKISTVAPALHCVPVVSPWYHIGIDFIGPISPASTQGSHYILTVADYFTKFVEAIPTPTKHAEGVASNLFKLFMRMGIPKVITSDQGSEFNNKLNDAFMERLQIDHRLTTPYHPQANGLVERFNQTIQTMLVKFIESKKETWQDYLDTCVYAYNTSRHDSSKFTPFELMFGRQAVLPVDIRSDASKIEDVNEVFECDEDAVQKMEAARKSTLEQAKKNIVAAQQKQKEIYDKKHCTNKEVYSVDAMVLKKDFTRKKRKGGKLDSKWIGPFKITKSLGKGLYSLESFDDPPVTVGRVNGVHLKPWNGEISDLQDDSRTSNPPAITKSEQDQLEVNKQDSEMNGSIVLAQDVQEIVSNPPLSPPMPPLSPEPPLMSSTPTKQVAKFEPKSDPAIAEDKQRPTVSATSGDDCVITKCSIPTAPLTRVKRRQVMQLNRRKTKRQRKECEQNDGDVKLTIVEVNLVKNGHMLKDRHIDAANRMLRKQFPEIRGLHSPFLGQSLSFPVTEAPFVQMLHVGSNHWMTVVATNESTVLVYDSMFRCVGTCVSMQSASMLQCTEDFIQFRIENAQIQEGGADCGLFAIAFATEYCFGNCPECYRYDQSQMRDHFVRCLESGEMSPFPSELVRRRRPAATKKIRLYCDCRLPEDGEEPMAYCECCRRWFHRSCQKIPDAIFYPGHKQGWFCSHCL